ncbi:uncharacterized protein [Anoplolepis gracilipes]|uniref:uncharacterized protein n=1 Tax=Anoplolepis gracilipes TaxID=354296 RepID=UPI003BA12266
MSQFCVGMEMMLNLILFKLKHSHLQKLLKEIEDFFRTSNDNERIVLQKYMDRYFYFFVFDSISNWIVYLSARLEMLCLEIRNAENEKFFNETKHTIQAILFKTNMAMGSIILFGVFPIIRKQSSWEVSQFIFITLSGSSRLFLIAWAADDLKENSEQVAMEIYNIPWFEKSRYNIKDICFMIQRSQIPLEISIRGLMPALSFEYFTKFTATMLSYFTAMKAIIDD